MKNTTGTTPPQTAGAPGSLLDARIAPIVAEFREAAEYGCTDIPDDLAISMAWDAWARRQTGAELAATLEHMLATFVRPTRTNFLWSALDEMCARLKTTKPRDDGEMTKALENIRRLHPK